MPPASASASPQPTAPPAHAPPNLLAYPSPKAQGEVSLRWGRQHSCPTGPKAQGGTPAFTTLYYSAQGPRRHAARGAPPARRPCLSRSTQAQSSPHKSAARLLPTHHGPAATGPAGWGPWLPGLGPAARLPHLRHGAGGRGEGGQRQRGSEGGAVVEVVRWCGVVVRWCGVVVWWCGGVVGTREGRAVQALEERERGLGCGHGDSTRAPEAPNSDWALNSTGLESSLVRV